MKNAKWMLPVMLLALSGLISAQSLTQSAVVAKVPFDFVVNNKVIPAGDCVVKGSDSDILAVSNFEARTSALASASRGDENPDDSTAMVFEVYGSQYFLTEIRIAGSRTTYKLPHSKAEKELRAQNAPASQLTLLASLK